MSEYQHYEFLALDRPLSRTSQEALRRISGRARISATRFSNTYEWGDLKADPIDLLARYFDVFFYWANWGTRQLAFRLPVGTVTVDILDQFGIDDALMTLREIHGHLVLDIVIDDEDAEDETWLEEGEDWMARLAPLRAELMKGDFGLLKLCRLLMVELGLAEDEGTEPMHGAPDAGEPLSAPQRAFAEFSRFDELLAGDE